MKKILILHNVKAADLYLNNIKATKFDEIILFDHLTAIFCHENNLKFTYLRKKKTFRSLNVLFKQAREVSLGIDKKIRKKFKNSYNFYQNYSYFARDYSLFKYLRINLIHIIKNKRKAFYYIKISKDKFNFFEELLNEIFYSNQYLLRLINVKQINYKKDNFFPDISDIYKISDSSRSITSLTYYYLINKFFKKIIEFFKKKNYFLSSDSTEVNDFIFFSDLTKIRSFNPLTTKIKKPFFSYKSEFIPRKYFEYNFGYIFQYVLSIANEVSSLDKIYRFKFFTTTAPTLKNNTIIDYFIRKKRKVFIYLHGGTVGHFVEGFLWPRKFPYVFCKNSLINIGYYSLQQLNLIKKKNVSYFVQNYIFPKIKISKNIKPKKITYVMQNNFNLNYPFSQDFNDPFKLFLFRDKFVKFCLRNKYSLLVSKYYALDCFAPKKTLNLAIKSGLYESKILSLDKGVHDSGTIIFEYFGTSLVNTILSGTSSNIILLYNPNLPIFSNQLKVLKKRVHIAKNYKDIFKYQKQKPKLKNKKEVETFIRGFYGL